MTPHGKTKAGSQRYLCRKDRGGCGFGLTEGGSHGGLRHRKYESNAERQKAYRKRKQQSD
jgi:hypothetical protein